MQHKNSTQRLALAGAFLAISGAAAMAQPTDITGVISAVDGYRTSAVVVAIALMLFLIGRSVVRKLVK